MKKLYLITAKDSTWNEYNSMLIRAENRKEAEELLIRTIHYCLSKDEPLSNLKDYGYSTTPLVNFKNYHIKEITSDGESEVIIASFNGA